MGKERKLVRSGDKTGKQIKRKAGSERIERQRLREIPGNLAALPKINN